MRRGSFWMDSYLHGAISHCMSILYLIENSFCVLNIDVRSSIFIELLHTSSSMSTLLDAYIMLNALPERRYIW
jgi:hypothetical protein